MKTKFQTKGIALAAIVGALAVPAVAAASPAPDVFERAAARAQVSPDVLERYAAAHPYGVRSQQAPASYRFTTDTLGGDGHAAVAKGYRMITDTLGGNGQPVQAPSYRFTTDTLGGSGSPVAMPGYSLITDTLGGNGGPGAVAATPSAGFNWNDAAIGAGIAVGAIALLSALLVLMRQQRHRPQMA
jgi:hypothetical protein